MFRRCVVLALAALFCPFARSVHANNCAGTSTGYTALTDLGAGFYQGAQGGLYAGGSNQRPAAHNAAGIVIANSTVPLDTLGNPDPTGGSVVLISIGMSNCTQEFSTFVPKAVGDPRKNPRVAVIDCARGGQSADLIKDPNAAYWDTVFTRLRGHGSSPLQPQVVWIKEANRMPTGGFPASADTLLWNLGSIVRDIKAKLPNVKLAYLTSRIYAGYASSNLNPEPYAYESGFAVKWLIDAQVSGEDSLNYDPGSGPVEAPWLSWGPYLWADGLAGRADGMTWTCNEFVTSDGTHPSLLGRTIVADSLLAFFRADETTMPWYLGHPASSSAPADDVRFVVTPVPARGPVEIAFTPTAGERWRLEIFDLSGRRVAEVASGVGTGAREVERWAPAGTARAGVYFARLSGDGGRPARRLVLLEAR